jgi:hypothetical protein
MCRGGGGFPLTNNNPYQQQNQTTPYVIVFHNNSTFSNYCNSALYSENKRYVLLKKNFYTSKHHGCTYTTCTYRHIYDLQLPFLCFNLTSRQVSWPLTSMSGKVVTSIAQAKPVFGRALLPQSVTFGLNYH